MPCAGGVTAVMPSAVPVSLASTSTSTDRPVTTVAESSAGMGGTGAACTVMATSALAVSALASVTM